MNIIREKIWLEKWKHEKSNTDIYTDLRMGCYLQIIRESDWIVDLGAEGGINGGKVIAEGTPEDIRSNKDSVTGRFI